jgi:hypothetical protein
MPPPVKLCPQSASVSGEKMKTPPPKIPHCSLRRYRNLVPNRVWRIVSHGFPVLNPPPFAAIFIGALAGAVLAVFIAPERVIAFAGGDGLPRPVALLKGVWLARASGYKSSLYGSDARRRDRQLRALRRLLPVEPAGHHRLLLRRRRMLPLEKSPEPPVAP